MVICIFTLFQQWLALRFPKAAIYLDSLRECYEAYVIYNFMAYLLAYLSANYDIELELSSKPPVKHAFPFCLLPPWGMGRSDQSAPHISHSHFHSHSLTHPKSSMTPIHLPCNLHPEQNKYIISSESMPCSCICRSFIHRCKQGAMSYTVVRLITTFIAL